MHRQRYESVDDRVSSWRASLAVVQQEVVSQRCTTSLPALQACLDCFPGLARLDVEPCAKDLAFLGQQLCSLSHQSALCGSQASGSPQSIPQEHTQLSTQQQAELLVLLCECTRFCQAVTEALAANRPQQPQSLRPRWQQRHRQQQQQQAPQLAQQQLPPAAATALCCCFRQWADPLSPSHPGSSSSAAETGLQMAAVTALGALLPAQLPVIAAHERAASLALLLALAQPPLAPCSSSTTGSSTCATASESSTGDRSQQNSQDWALACRAVAVLTDILQEGSSCSTSAAAPAAQPGRSTAAGQGRASSAAKAPAAAAGLHPDETSSITAALVEALSAACGIRSSSSRTGSTGSTGGSSSGSGAHKFSSSGTGAGNSSGSQEPAVLAAGAAGSKQQPLEGIQQSRYFAAVLTALNAAVVSNRQGWQSHAGALTESARKLFMYGTQQQQRRSASPSAVVASANGNSTPANTSSSNGAAAGASADAAAAPAAGAGAAGASSPLQAPSKPKYVPPHARAAARAATRPQPAAQQSQWQDSSDESELSASDSSDMSDTEAFQGSSRRASSSSTSSESNPIKAARVRTGLLQLLQSLIQMDPRALHSYWTALLPSQAPLQASPLSPHLVTMLLFDPVDKVRLLAAAVLGSLLEGPTARSLLAVAEAKSAQPPIRGFTTMSVSLGHMLLSLHTGLLAIVQAWQQQQQQQQQQSQILPVPAVLLTAVLRVLCVLLPSTPYERMPSTLLPHVVQTTWELWQQLQPPNPAVDAAAAPPAPAPPREQQAAGAHRRAAVPSLDVAATQRGCGSSSSSSSSSILTAAVAVLAQAFSTKKPLPALGRWLQATDPAEEAAATGAIVARSGTSNSIGNSSRLLGQATRSQQGSTPSSGGNSSSSGSGGSSGGSGGSLFGSRLVSYLLTAAGSPDCCLRIEALAAMRGACINYPQLLLLPELAAVGSCSSSSSSPSCAGVSSQCCWQQLLAVAEVSVAAAAQPASTRTPRSSPRVTHASAEDPPAAAPAAGAADGSSSTSPEVKAGQHAVRLLGDWLAAVAAATGSAEQVSPAAPDASDNSGAVPSGQQQRQQGYETHRLAGQWTSTLQLLLSEAVWHHPSPVIRSAAAAVCGGIPADVWLLLPLKLHQQLLLAAAATAIGSDVTAVRAAACKLLGSCAVLPGALAGQLQQQQLLPVEQQALQYQQQQQQQLRQDQQLVEPVQQQHQVLQALSQCVGDQAVSVRLSAAWAMANVCDELKRQQDLLSSSSFSTQHSPALPTSQAQPQQQPQQHQHGGLQNNPGLSGLSLGPVAMQLLCNAAVAAASDTEKVRAHGVRALGALLATWQLAWGLDCSSSSADTAMTAAAAPRPPSASAAECAVPVGWAWAAAWLQQALGVLQACLAARSMKVVWNAACAVAAALQNQQLLKAPASASSVPGLLLMLVVLLRDSSNYKIKTHAAAALAAPPDRAAYGEVFSDALLGVLSALQTLQGSSSSSSVQQPPPPSAVPATAAVTQKPEVAAAGGAAAALMGAAEGDGGDDEGTFPNYRYIPGLMQQLELSLLHMLPLLKPADATRLKEPLRRNQQLLLSLAAKAAKGCAGQQQQAAPAGAACSNMGCTTGANCVTALAQGQHAAGRGMLAAGPAEGSAQVDGQCAAQSALPADPFGQGPRLSSDGAVSEYACSCSSGSGRGPASTTTAAGRSTCAVHTSYVCGQDAGAAAAAATVGAAPAGSTFSGGLLDPPDAVKGLSQVLGPGVLDAWAGRHGNILGHQQAA